MNTETQINDYIASQPLPKRSDMEALHQLMLGLQPGMQLWFDNGKNAENKTVTNPTIGYGHQVLQYADGKTKPFFRIGISATTTGITIYILGIKDKTYLATTYSDTIGKAKITGYCIKFKKLQDVHIGTLEAALQYGLQD